MFSLAKLLLLILAGVIAVYWWQSGLFKGRAREAAAHCRQLGLQLLDQSMVITSIRPIRGSGGRIEFRRTYQFEFSSTGDRRYQGKLVMRAMRLESIELEAYKLPDAD
jgi:hypothetical protein